MERFLDLIQPGRMMVIIYDYHGKKRREPAYWDTGFTPAHPEEEA
jgi:hypothetical protein